MVCQEVGPSSDLSQQRISSNSATFSRRIVFKLSLMFVQVCTVLYIHWEQADLLSQYVVSYV